MLGARVSDDGRRVRTLADALALADDPATALRAVIELRRELDALEATQVQRALAAGCSFADVARALGISRQAAHRRYRDLAPRPERRTRLVATDESRRVVRLAYAESAPSPPGSRHVLLGVLGTDSDAARALHAVGVTLERARAHAPHTDGSSRMRSIVQQAGRIAISRGDGLLRPEHLCLAALADPDGGAHATLTALGLPRAAVDELRRALAMRREGHS